MKTFNTFILLITAALIASWPVFAQPPGKGHGSGHGRMTDDFRGIIHSLFAAHDKVERSVELTKDGYRASTSSKDPKVAEMIQKHVSQMESRLEGGLGVRHWDPAFAELREHYGEMDIKWEKTDGGVAVNVIGKTPEAIAVAKNHAKIISGFVKKGEERMHATHPAVVAKADAETVATTEEAGKAGACENCRGGQGKGNGKGAGACACGGKGNCGKGDKP